MKLLYTIILFLGVFTPILSQDSANPFPEKSVSFTSSNLPIIVIESIEDILDEPKVYAEMGVIYNGEGLRNNITDAYNNFSGSIGIEIRGSSSQSFPKKQYAIEIWNSEGEDTSVSLLGLPKESDWILFGPYNDKTLIRDALMYKISNSIGRYASRSMYCELVLNGDYKGIYILFEKIKRDKNRVDIANLGTQDTTGIELTGGYIIKIDKVEGNDTRGWYSPSPPFPNAWQRVYYQYDTPDPDDITNKQENYIQAFINEFEIIMKLNTYNDSLKGYPKYIDIPSFVDFFLLNELSRNVDGFRLSSFMYKDKDKEDEPGKLVMGPIWDFNLGFGNADYYQAWEPQGLQLLQMLDNEHYDSFMPPFWWKVLYNDSTFKSMLIKRWNELRKDEFSYQRVYSYIDSLSVLLDEARIRNFEKWNVLGEYVWPNYFIGQTFEEEIDYLKTWISDRVIWLDSELKGTADVVSDNTSLPERFALYQNYPNPFNPATIFKYHVPESGVTNLKLFDVLGNEIKTLLSEFKTPGEYQYNFDGSGLSSGVYYYQLTTGDLISTKKMILLK